MAQKTKTILTRAAHEKLKIENAKRAKGMKVVKVAGERKVKEREGKKEGVMNKVEVGVTCLTSDKEIPKWHRAPYLTITISKGNQGGYARNKVRSLFSNHCGDGPYKKQERPFW